MPATPSPSAWPQGIARVLPTAQKIEWIRDACRAGRRDMEVGQDFPRLLALCAKVAQWLDEEVLHGSLWRAGLPKTMQIPGATLAATAAATA